jgi:hypothetical protein
MGHTFSVFDERCTYRPGSTRRPERQPEESKNLAAKKDEYLFQVDITPTISI